MKGLKYLITITQREYTERYLEFFRKNGVDRVIKKLCQGTASQKTLSYLGLENTNKVMFETVVHTQSLTDIIKGLYLEMDIGSAYNGVAIVMSMDCVGGMSSLKYLAGDREIDKEEEEMSGETKNVLIITIVDKGNTELVMESARSAGATGGTVVKANGTGAEIAKFFGISISEEKEMVYIIVKREERDAIMHAIMEKAGSSTEAHGVLFSLPVDKVIGIKHFEEI